MDVQWRRTVETRLAAIEERLGLSGDSRPHLERVRQVLARAKKPMTCGAIAVKAKVSASAARLVLYTNRETFERVPETPTRVKWRLAAKDPTP